MVPTHRARVGDALDLLFEVLRPYVEREMRAVYKDQWLKKARAGLHGKAPERWDTSDLLTLIYHQFFPVFRDLGHKGRSWVSLLREVRKRWAHQADLSLDETRRALETAVLLLRAVGAEAEAARLEPHMLALMQQELREKAGAAGPAAARGGEADREGGARAEKVPLSGRLRRFRLFSDSMPAEPLELRRDLLDEVERAVEPHRSHPVFNRLTIHILAEDGRIRALFETALEGLEEPFRPALLRRLADARLPAPADLSVGWKFYGTAPKRLAGKLGGRLFYVELGRRNVVTSATLTVLVGKTDREHYTLRSGATATVGRLSEVHDAKGRLVRRNTVAFLDYEDPRLSDEEQRIHRTVSRCHASLRYDAAEAVFLLSDDQSTCGTSIVREGYPVPIQVKQQPIALQEGDLLYFGRACVRFSAGVGGRSRRG